jgi:polysaccharide deacetylase 2 family uncharacterized protein YibQ
LLFLDSRTTPDSLAGDLARGQVTVEGDIAEAAVRRAISEAGFVVAGSAAG